MQQRQERSLTKLLIITINKSFIWDLFVIKRSSVLTDGRYLEAVVTSKLGAIYHQFSLVSHLEKSKCTKMRHYKSRKNLHSSYWSDVSGGGSKKVDIGRRSGLVHISCISMVKPAKFIKMIRYCFARDVTTSALVTETSLCRRLSPILAASGLTTEMREMDGKLDRCLFLW